jgi:hypothetical protein
MDAGLDSLSALDFKNLLQAQFPALKLPGTFSRSPPYPCHQPFFAKYFNNTRKTGISQQSFQFKSRNKSQIKVWDAFSAKKVSR